MSTTSKLYETDYCAWAKRQIELLGSRRFADLDIAHLVEELEDMGRSERNELESRLTILLWLPRSSVEASPDAPASCAQAPRAQSATVDQRRICD